MTASTVAPVPSRSDGQFEATAPVNAEFAAEPPVGIGTPASDVAEDDVVDIWGHGSFPASDPPANW
jgi:hypothetical protein